jgi:hypothetical protein
MKELGYSKVIFLSGVMIFPTRDVWFIKRKIPYATQISEKSLQEIFDAHKTKDTNKGGV